MKLSQMCEAGRRDMVGSLSAIEKESGNSECQTFKKIERAYT